MADEELKKMVGQITLFQTKSLIKKSLIRPKVPSELEELQNDIINFFIEIEKLISDMIRVKLWAKVYDENNPLPSMRLLAAVYQIVEYLPYREKKRILVSLEHSFNHLRNRIMDMYKLRNEFAHLELRVLLKKYNTEDKNGAQNIIRKYKFMEKLLNDIVDTGLKVKDYSTYSNYMSKKINEARKQVNE